MKTFCKICGIEIDLSNYDGNQQWIDDCCCTPACATERNCLPVIRPLAEMLMAEFDQEKLNISAIKKALFKGSSAGITMHIVDNYTIVVCCIVENGDQEITGGKLSWPFTKEEFWRQVEEVNWEAERIFEENEAEEI